METMESWDIALLVVVAYLAVVTLVRLMARHRDQLVARFRHDVQREQKHHAAQPDDKQPPTAQRRAG